MRCARARRIARRRSIAIVDLSVSPTMSDAIDLTGLSDEEDKQPAAAEPASEDEAAVVASAPPTTARDRPKRRRGSAIEDHLARFEREVGEALATGQSGALLYELRDRQDAELASLQQDESDALLQKQQRERGLLLALHAQLRLPAEAPQEARGAAREGDRDGNARCGVCSTRIDVEGDGEDWYVCGSCTSAFHITCAEEEACRTCQTSYCEECSGFLDSCLGCIEHGVLTCCGLEQLPCGAHECESCIDNHGDHCRLCVRRLE